MACKSCERRRREMAIYAQAIGEWSAKPFGPNITIIYNRLLDAAKKRGEFDGLDGPDT
jgi:hypothetical protein